MSELDQTTALLMELATKARLEHIAEMRRKVRKINAKQVNHPLLNAERSGLDPS